MTVRPTAEIDASNASSSDDAIVARWLDERSALRAVRSRRGVGDILPVRMVRVFVRKTREIGILNAVKMSVDVAVQRLAAKG